MRRLILILIVSLQFPLLLVRAQTPVLHLPTGHSERITDLLPGKDNKYLVSFSREDGKIFVTHTAYRKMLYEISDASALYYKIHVVKDSNQVIAVGVNKANAEGFVEFFDIRNGKSVKKITGLRIGKNRLPQFSQNYRYFVSADFKSSKVGLYDIHNWKVNWLEGFDIKKTSWEVFDKVKFHLVENSVDGKPEYIITAIPEKGIYISNTRDHSLQTFLDSLVFDDVFECNGNHFLITKKLVGGHYFGDNHKQIWHLEKQKKVYDVVGGRILAHKEKGYICLYDSNSNIRFYHLIESASGWNLQRDTLLEQHFKNRFTKRLSFKLIGYLKEGSRLLFQDNDSLFILDLVNGNLKSILSCEYIEDADIIYSSDGDECITARCNINFKTENWCIIHELADGNFVSKSSPNRLTNGVYVKTLDQWISANSNVIQYRQMEGEENIYRVEGKIVAASESNFIARDTTGNQELFSIICDDGKVRLYNCNNGTLAGTFESEKGEIHYAQTINSGKMLLTISNYTQGEYHQRRSLLELWNIKTGDRIKQIISERDYIDAAATSADGTILFYEEEDYFKKWDLQKDVLLDKKYVGEVKKINVNKTGDFMILQDNDGVDLWSVDSFSKVLYIPSFGISNAVFSASGEEILVNDFRGLEEYRIEDTLIKIHHYDYYTDTLPNGRTHFVKGHEQNVLEAAYSKNGKWIVSVGLDGQLIIWDRKTGKIVNKRQSNLGRVTGISFSSDNNRFVTSSVDQRIKIWDLQSSEELATIVLLKGDASITMTPESYYYATGEVSQFVSWQVGDMFLSFEQLDIKYNRPDLVLRSLHSPDSNLVEAYKLAYLKRLERLNYTITDFNNSNSPPEVSVMSPAFSNYLTDSCFVKITIHAEEANSALTALHIRMNGVPVYGAKGLELSERNIRTFDTIVRVDLIEGVNKIEVSAINKSGLESLREPNFVKRNMPVGNSPKVYFVGIAMNSYQQNSHNLKYSVKDIRDLVKALKKRYPTSLIVDTLLDNRVTVASIDSLFERLKSGAVNDKLIFSFSGHGLLSDQFDYFLSTYDVDFTHPELKGYSYEKLEARLGELPMRRKLFMIDACHSGEVDKASMLALNERMDATGLKGAKSVVTRNDLSHLGLQNSFDIMNELFLKVGNETGTTVISAAAGTQFAMENSKYSNGVFTYAVLELLSKEKEISVSELQKWVITRVPELTKGLQQPTTRSVNFSLDWSF
ncbi:MAG: hypothetical protein GC181_07490 [Bacteroidetes bacterium]|nr:hypothetical protein [Bacteroidota bacterium]